MTDREAIERATQLVNTYADSDLPLGYMELEDVDTALYVLQRALAYATDSNTP